MIKGAAWPHEMSDAEFRVGGAMTNPDAEKLARDAAIYSKQCVDAADAYEAIGMRVEETRQRQTARVIREQAQRIKELEANYEQKRDACERWERTAGTKIDRLQAQVAELETDCNKCAKVIADQLQKIADLQAENARLRGALENISGAAVLTAPEDIDAKAANHDAMIVEAREALGE